MPVQITVQPKYAAALTTILEKWIADADRVIATFQKDFATNPGYAISQSAIFTAAARNQVARRTLYQMGEGGQTAEQLAEELLRQMVSAASYNSRSTSASSDFFESEVARAAVELYQYLTCQY